MRPLGFGCGKLKWMLFSSGGISIRSIFSSSLMRLCTCFALVAWARKRLMKTSNWRNFDPFDFFQLLDAALHLLCFGGLGTEAVDEDLQLADAVLLIFISRLQLRPALGLLLFIPREAAGVEVQSLVP